MDRSYIWYLLYDHIDLLKVLPNEYLDCVVSNIGIEQEQMTVQRILDDTSKVYNYYLKEDQRAKYAPLIYKALLAKLK